MSHEIGILTATAALIGFLHTVLGPDHYLPFVMMGRAHRWSLLKTAVVTGVCGLGHIFSSMVLGAMGIALGLAVTKLEMLESMRGSLAAWLLIGFGGTYCLWGLRRAIKSRPHEHRHAHERGPHVHPHGHEGEHIHFHKVSDKTSLTPWILFTVFIFGPCEALIPVLMYPAVTKSLAGLVWVCAVFGAVTLATMIGVVLIMSWGANLLALGRLERYTHALAGATICLCGVAIRFLGL